MELMTSLIAELAVTSQDKSPMPLVGLGLSSRFPACMSVSHHVHTIRARVGQFSVYC